MPKICKNIRNRHFNLSSFRSLFFPTSLHTLNAMWGPAWHCKRFNRQSRTAKPTHLNISQITQWIFKTNLSYWFRSKKKKKLIAFTRKVKIQPLIFSSKWNLSPNSSCCSCLCLSSSNHFEKPYRYHVMNWSILGKSWIACRHENWNEYLDIFVSSA